MGDRRAPCATGRQHSVVASAVALWAWRSGRLFCTADTSSPVPCRQQSLAASCSRSRCSRSSFSCFDSSRCMFAIPKSEWRFCRHRCGSTRGRQNREMGGRVSGSAANAGIGWDCLMPCVTSFAGPPVLPSMRYSRLRRWSVVYASVYELHARVSDGGGGPSYDR